RGSEQDRRFDVAHLFYLRGASQFAEAVAHEDSCGNLLAVKISGVGQDRGDAGADVVAPKDGGLADLYAGDISDGVKRTGRQHADFQAQLRCARPRTRSLDLGNSRDE